MESTNDALIDIEKTVAVFMNRSEKLLDILYKCFQQKITYIPIDVSWPLDRINYVLRDSKVKRIITERKYTDLFPEYECLTIENSNEIDQLFSCMNNNEISYVLYTSGSTGTPKGVAIKRTSLINLIEGITEIIDLSSNDTIACITSVSFDIFFVESIMAKYLGMNVVMANNEEQNNPKYLARLIQENGVNVIQMTPSRMQLLLLYDEELKCLKNVRCIMIGGEAFPLNLLKILQKKTKAKIFNMYGPTETTVWSTISELTNKNKIDIGLPIKNTQIYILNEKQEIITDGSVGEICIAGEGLAKGYIGKKELTEEKFVKIPELNNTLIYHTGDSGRYSESGEIECLGRIDNQIKLNGYRIELEEIEANMARFEGITQALVVLEKQNEISKLVAYYIGNQIFDPAKIIRFLKTKIPLYMIPSEFHRVNEFKYTSSGKIDRHSISSKGFVGEDEKTKNSIDEKQKDILRNVCNSVKKDISEEDLMKLSFSDAGIDSVTYYGIIAKLEDTYDIVFDEYALHAMNFYRISDFIEYCGQFV